MPLPEALPQTPPDAGQWAADRLSRDGWQSMQAGGPDGGRPSRWHPCPLELEDVRAKWGAGVYRIHYRTAGRRPLGTSEPFRVLELGATPDAPAKPAAGPVAVPVAAPTAAPGPSMEPAVGKLLEALGAAQKPKRSNGGLPPGLEWVHAWNLMEERSNDRSREVRQAQEGAWKAVAEMQRDFFTSALELVQQKHAETQALHEKHSAELTAIRSADQIARQELEATLRAELARIGGKLEELEELEEPAPIDPEQLQKPGDKVIAMLGGPEAVANLLKFAITKAVEKYAGPDAAAIAAGLPSPDGADGGSLGE